MHLTSRECEEAFAWIKEQVEAMPESAPDYLTWRVSTTQLYNLLCLHLYSLGLQSIPIEDLWGIIQIAYPRVTIIGQPGNRAFAGIRRTYPPTDKDLAWAAKLKQSQIDWEKKFDGKESRQYKG